jgi:4-hydroxy-tetrahydrodipicolinate synthase
MNTICYNFSSEINNFIIGVGGNNTDECINNITIGSKFGFNKFMLTTPYYNKPTQAGLEAHFKTICNKFKNYDFILYNVPSRTNVNLLPKTLVNICEECINVTGIKEASGDLNQMILIRRLCPKLKLYCGDDGLTVPAMSIGAYGIISVISNYCPKICNLIIERCNNNNYDGAFELYSQIDDIVRLLFSETNPSPIKFLLFNKGLIGTDNVRLPLVKMQDETNKNKLILLTNKLITYNLAHFI